VANDSTRKLVSILAALLSGASTYSNVRRDEEERRRDRERQAAQDARAEAGVELQRKWFDRATAEDKRRVEEQAATRATASNQSAIQAGSDFAAKAFPDPAALRGTDSVPIAGAAGRRVASETIPLITDSGGITPKTLDLQRFLQNRLKPEGEGGSLPSAISDIGGRAGLVASAEKVDQESNTAAFVEYKRKAAEFGVDVGEYQRDQNYVSANNSLNSTVLSQRVARQINPPQGPQPREPGQFDIETEAEGIIKQLESQGLPKEAGAPLLEKKFGVTRFQALGILDRVEKRRKGGRSILDLIRELGGVGGSQSSGSPAVEDL